MANKPEHIVTMTDEEITQRIFEALPRDRARSLMLLTVALASYAEADGLTYDQAAGGLKVAWDYAVKVNGQD